MSTSPSPTKIPRRRGVDEMWKAIGLHRNSDAYYRLKANIRDLAKKIVDVHKSWPNQQQAHKVAFVKKVVEVEPSLDRYEQAWPAQLYITKYLAATAHNFAKKSGLLHNRRMPSPTASEPEVTVTREPIAPRTLFDVLQAFDPPLGHIAEPLILNGLDTNADLMAFKRWPDNERRSFLKDDARLNPFLARQLIVALDYSS
ncbi:hypothetical protein EIP86_003159 [Pleurotus ostreatoroseus]|nr:hypothetical protein EIP86_003159 [Pleurotus ostreatoroseus]